jgi:pimeloyl-ACP methyl ester carboxylesterase
MNKDVYVGAWVALLCSAAVVSCANARANPNSGGPRASGPPRGPLPSIVLVHGAFVDGSGWEGVYQILRRDGYPVSVVQNPTTSLADDVAVTRRAIGAQSNSVILVGHSYGGVVISEAGNDPKVAALVYITAFAPDKGESVQTLIANPPPGAPVPPILPPRDGFLFLDASKFATSFAADVNPDKAAFMAASQVPWAAGAISAAVTAPAWRAKPSWYLVATADKMIPPLAQRSMAKRAGATIKEAEGSHAIFVSRPDVVASVIEQAAAATSPHGK